MNNPKDIFMLCESIQDKEELKKLDRNRYKANTKFDGCRCIAVKKGKDIILFGRRNTIYNTKFREVVEALKLINFDFMIDGEVTDFTNNFNLLQKRALTKNLDKIKELEKEIPVKYMIFDILSFGEKSLTNEPLHKRLNLLRNLLSNNKSQHLELVEYGEIDDLLALAISNNGEGIVIKDMFGIYESKRSKGWCKHKLFKETTITITGYTENPAGIRATDNENNVVQISGNQSNEVKQILNDVGYATINIQYLELTKENRFRFPSYRGLVK